MRHNGFQDRRFRPLSHPTYVLFFVLPNRIYYTISGVLCQVNNSVFGYGKTPEMDSGATEFRRSIPTVHFASTGAAYLEAAGAHGASVL